MSFNPLEVCAKSYVTVTAPNRRQSSRAYSQQSMDLNLGIFPPSLPLGNMTNDSSGSLYQINWLLGDMSEDRRTRGTTIEKGIECPNQNWAWQIQGPYIAPPLFSAATSLGFTNSTNNASLSSTAVPFLTYHHYNPSIRSGTSEYCFRS